GAGELADPPGQGTAARLLEGLRRGPSKVSEHETPGTPGDQPGDDPTLSRALRERLGRSPASTRLRSAVREAIESPAGARSRGGTGWLGPAAADLAPCAGHVAVLLRRGPRRRVVPASAGPLSWSRTLGSVSPAALPRAMDESGVTLNWVFAGESE